jgi:energy-coupling factor transport system ATP-binding protein
VSGLSYTYSRGPQALHDVTLRVSEGDFLALVGSNGSGKTTLALHLVGILRPPPASVTILGRDIAATPSWEIPSLIGYVFQNPEHQFVTDTVLGEVRYTLRRRGLGESDATAEAHRVLTRYGLAPVADLHPYQLSQGAKRRLSVLTVLVAAPRVLVLDEPTFGQDARTNHALLADMVRLNEQGLTILMITHDMDAVGQFARSVAVMHEGRITHHGAVANLPRTGDRLEEAGLELPFAMRVRTLTGAA